MWVLGRPVRIDLDLFTCTFFDKNCGNYKKKYFVAKIRVLRVKCLIYIMYSKYDNFFRQQNVEQGRSIII